MRAKRIKFTIDSNLEDVFLVGLAVNKLCSIIPSAHIDPHQIELCVVEAVNNAIEHAYDNKTGHKVEVIFTLESDRLTLDICDSGRPMERKHLAYRKRLDFPPAEVHRLSERGRGLAIIQEIADEVEYQTIQGKNKLTLIKWLRASNTPRPKRAGMGG